MYDPFGNLLQQNVTSGSAPALNVTVDSTTNRVTTAGFTYDVAGNLVQSPTGASPSIFSYDSQNRMTRASYAGGAAINYYYGANGERLYDGAHWHFYGPDGTHLETLTKNAAGGTFGLTVEELHFAGRLVFQDYYPVVTDRLGSVVQMGKGNGAINQGSYPYGQAISGLPQPTNSAPPNYGSVVYPSSGSVSDVVFGTYHRDGYGLDYALNRYYDPARTRFTSPDPYVGSGGLSGDSWNRYSYTEGDPVNQNDPEGLVRRSMQAPERGRRPAQSSASATLVPSRVGPERGPITTSVPSGPGISYTPPPPTSPLGGSFFWGDQGTGSKALTPSELGMQMADTHPGYVPPHKPTTVQTISACETGVVYAGIAAGIGNALGVGPPGSDASTDVANQIVQAVGNPLSGGNPRTITNVSAVLYGALRTLLAGPAAAEFAALVAESSVPVLGAAALTYIAYKGVVGYKEYYESNIGSCHH